MAHDQVDEGPTGSLGQWHPFANGSRIVDGSPGCTVHSKWRTRHTSPRRHRTATNLCMPPCTGRQPRARCPSPIKSAAVSSGPQTRTARLRASLPALPAHATGVCCRDPRRGAPLPASLSSSRVLVEQDPRRRCQLCPGRQFYVFAWPLDAPGVWQRTCSLPLPIRHVGIA